MVFSSKTWYYLALVVCMAAAFWLGYGITHIARGSSLSTIYLGGAIAAALIVGVGVVYFLTRHRHINREIPCKIQDTQNVKVNNYHFIMATGKRTMGIASVKSTDHVNGITVEPVNRDVMPHRIKIEVRLNQRSDEIVGHDMVINPGAAAPVALPFPERFRLADISYVDIRIRQV